MPRPSDLEDDDVREAFVAGAMFTGLAYSRDEARGWFNEWLIPLVCKAQAEALREAELAVAKLRPSGFTVLTSSEARARDGVLWEAQRIVGLMRRAAEQNSEGNET